MIEVPPFLRNHPSARNRIRKSLQRKEQLGFPEEIVPADQILGIHQTYLEENYKPSSVS